MLPQPQHLNGVFEPKRSDLDILTLWRCDTQVTKDWNEEIVPRFYVRFYVELIPGRFYNSN